MFQSTAIPGILPARPVKGTVVVARRREKVHASMTANNPGEAHEESVPDDAQALTALYEQFRRPIHSYIYRLLGNQEDADDVTQEVFVRAFISWESLYDRSNLSAWLYRIATNLCVDQLRRRKRITWWPLSFQNSNDEHFESKANEDHSLLLLDSGGIPEIAEREHIQLALTHMPEEYAIVLVLSAAQGLPYQEIAKIVGISPNAAATRLSRAKRM
ncbi:MAG TPA: RNA polymerase sigma factor, partial [Ktedonobacteraceae bacterium]|nr:RNA polymerase sigma factor [Ktedonobacteraceae bacterium]